MIRPLACLLLCFFSILLSVSSYGQNTSLVTAPHNETNPLNFNWKMILSGYNLDSEITSAQLTHFDFRSQFTYGLLSDLNLDLRPFARIEMGSSQSMDPEDKAETRVYLNQAAAIYTPARWLKISAGAMNQESLHSKIITGRQTFPEIRIESNFLDHKYWQAGPLVSQAVPSSIDLSPETGDKEPMPQLSTAGVFIKFEEYKDNATKIKLNYFQYSGLPQSVRNASVLRGNTPSDILTSETNYDLKYQYKGLDAQVNSVFPISRGLGGILEGNYVKNQGAPSEKNQAYQIGGGAEIKLSGQSFLQITGHNYRIESDATVAKYSSSDYFFTNRIGYGIESYLKMKKSGFRVGAIYREAGLITESETQSRIKVIMLRLETLNDNI